MFFHRQILHLHHDHDHGLHRPDHLHHEHPPLWPRCKARSQVGQDSHPAVHGQNVLCLWSRRELHVATTRETGASSGDKHRLHHERSGRSRPRRLCLQTGASTRDRERRGQGGHRSDDESHRLNGEEPNKPLRRLEKRYFHEHGLRRCGGSEEMQETRS